MKSISSPILEGGLVSIRKLEHLLGFDRRDICRVSEHAGRYYRPFDRRKPNGSWRHIDNPTGILKKIQQRVQRQLLTQITFPSTVLGAVPGRSIRDNGEFHTGKKWLVTVDLRDCFPRISHRRVYSGYKTLGCSAEIAGLLTKLTAFQHRLPQGAPTSSSLANLVLAPMHAEISDLAEELDLQATFWVDDIAISGVRTLEAIEPTIRIIGRHGHAVRCRKKQIMPQWDRQSVTGVGVNRKAAYDRVSKEELRREILALADSPDIAEYRLRSVRGKIAHVNYICPHQGLSLKRLADRVLPDVGIPGEKPFVPAETRPCRNARRHSYLRRQS